MAIAIIGAGMSGLIGAHASDYTALVLEGDRHLNSSFGDMLGAKFVHESPETRKLFAYDGPAGTVEVSSDAVDAEIGLESYVRKTRHCTIWDIPQSERDSAMNWGMGSFKFLPVEVVTWARSAAERAGVVFDAKVMHIQRKEGRTQLKLRTGTSVEADKVLFTIPLPIMMGLAGVPNGHLFQSYRTTVGKFRMNTSAHVPTTMHYITDRQSPITRITTYRDSVVVEASAEQTPELLAVMSRAAQRRAIDLDLTDSLNAAGFSTFFHHFAYFPGFEKQREIAHLNLADLGLYPLGRYAQFNHRYKTRETYMDAKAFFSDGST